MWNDTWYISGICRKAAGIAGLPQYRLHDLCHTFAPYLVMERGSLRAIQDLMRYRSYESTLVYAHLSPDYCKNESEKLKLNIPNGIN